METLKLIDLDQIRLPEPKPAPLPSLDLEMLDLATESGLQVMPQIQVFKYSGNSYELVTGIQTYRVANVLQIFNTTVLVLDIDIETIRLMQQMDFTRRPKPATPLQLGRSILKLSKSHGYSHAKSGRELGLANRREASRCVRLLSLPGVIIEMIENDSLHAGTARCLLPLPEPDQLKLAKKAAQEKWTTQRMEDECRTLRNNDRQPADTKPASKQGSNQWESISEQETILSESIGSPVHVLFQPGTGHVQIVISCSNLDVYEGVSEKLMNKQHSDRKGDGDTEFYL